MTSQLLLPGQAAAPDGPIDLGTMYVMHFGFRRDLAAFAASAGTPVADRARWQALRARWAKFAMILEHHHTVEDEALWPRLVRRAEDAGNVAATATLHAMEAEHGEIDPMLEECAADLDRLADAPDEDARAAFQVRIVAFRERLGRHLAHEESDAMPLVQRYLTQQDWTATEKVANKRASVALIKYLMPWGRYRLPPEAAEWVRRTTPAGTRLMVAVLEPMMRPSFLRLERTAFAGSETAHAS